MIISELLGYGFMQHALVTALLTSIVCGIMGTYIVTKRLVFISGGITHASFGGIGIAYFLGFNPLLGAAVFSVLSALGIEWLSKENHKIRPDSSIAIFWSFGMAAGVIFIFLTPGYAPNLITYLFGSILTVTLTEIYVLLFLTLIISGFFILFYRIILSVAFDEEFARTRQIPVGAIKNFLMALTALSIIMSIRVAGIILVISLLTIPQATANIFYRSFRAILFASIVIGFTGCLSGIFLSYLFDIPSGASIIFVLVIIFILSGLYKQMRTRILLRPQL